MGLGLLAVNVCSYGYLVHGQTTIKAGESHMRHSKFPKMQGCDPRLKALDVNLRSLLPFGLAFHHSGLCAADRHLVEGLFLKSAVQVGTSR